MPSAHSIDTPDSPLAPGIRSPDVLIDLAFPEVRALAARLRFSPNEGRIWLEERRCVLMHTEAFTALRTELLASFGARLTREIFTRIGYATGQRDAEMAKKISTFDASSRNLVYAGGVFHALQGFVMPLRAGSSVLTSTDMNSPDYHAEGFWKDSIEAEAHVAEHGIGPHPACWFSVGYCSGYLSACAGVPILVRETECQAMGHAQCRIVARPAAMWADVDKDARPSDPARPPPGAAASGAHDGPRRPAEIVAPYAEQQEVPGNEQVIGSSTTFKVLRHKLQRVAQTQATVLLLGENGVGKSLIAREIHRQSRRADAPFVEVNCAAIPEQLVESELFGVERGAFSGATAARAGRFEAAHGGTLFLDEIATLSMTAQGKLLRVLQNGEMERLGSNRTIQADVRLIAATNEDLKFAVRNGLFRQDLYFRLNVFPILIPPLRERRDDIPLLTQVLLDRFARRHGRNIPGITPAAMQTLIHHDWPGNIRELENVLERGVIMIQDDEVLDTHHLTSVDDALNPQGFLGVGDHGALTLGSETGQAAVADHSIDAVAENMLLLGTGTLPEMEDALVRAAIRQAGGNISRAARLLGVTRSQLDYRAKKIGR
ncbi:sigma-54-dependent Fis family transcriptional regulator [Thauera sinica]|uniref:Sigma 54-interacting transcriptional regulator n=1 Tax=Thauera sinica TaxID=2665146 RepID=A0ABW1AX82_9RHOO|nr:sigma-54-dependent Fis family transcriptional regulator [Thauera sp. K11]ATE58644.1 sigma-54-dependent Fis family transcriptional regulator [Thauera sp. K11]